jgi:hypothetical protein
MADGSETVMGGWGWENMGLSSDASHDDCLRHAEDGHFDFSPRKSDEQTRKRVEGLTIGNWKPSILLFDFELRVEQT